MKHNDTVPLAEMLLLTKLACMDRYLSLWFRVCVNDPASAAFLIILNQPGLLYITGVNQQFFLAQSGDKEEWPRLTTSPIVAPRARRLFRRKGRVNKCRIAPINMPVFLAMAGSKGYLVVNNVAISIARCKSSL